MPAGARSGLKPLPPLFPAASSQAWEKGMGLTAAPSLAKSCSPRIRLGPWLRVLRRRLFSPPRLCTLSISQDHPNSCTQPELLPLPWRTPGWESVCGPCSHGSRRGRSGAKLGVGGGDLTNGDGSLVWVGRGSTQVLSSSLVSLERPGLRGPQGNRESRGPVKDVPEPPGGTYFIPRCAHRSQTGGGSKAQTPTVLRALWAGPLHPAHVLLAGDSGIRSPTLPYLHSVRCMHFLRWSHL